MCMCMCVCVYVCMCVCVYVCMCVCVYGGVWRLPEVTFGRMVGVEEERIEDFFFRSVNNITS